MLSVGLAGVFSDTLSTVPLNEAAIAAGYLDSHNAVVAGDWAALDAAGARLLIDGAGTLEAAMTASLESEGGAGVFEGALLAIARAAFRNHPQTPADMDAIANAMAERRGTNAQSIRPRLEELEQRLTSTSDWLAPMRRPVEFPQVSGALAALTRGLLARLHASFNSRHGHALARAVPNDRIETMFRDLVADQRATHSAMLTALQAACAEGRHDDPVKVALELGHFSRRAVGVLGRALAVAQLLTQRFLDAGSNMRAEALGQAAVEGNFLVRRIIATTLGAARLATAPPGREADERIAAVRTSASEMPLSATLPNGTDRDIHHLGADDDGRMVEIRGRVTEVSTRTDADERRIGRIVVDDPSNGAATEAVGYFIDPSRVGISVGCFVRLSGVYQTVATANQGDTAVVIERLSRSEYAEGGWEMLLAWLAREWFPALRNGHSLFWSLAPHASAPPAAQVAPGGAGELLFMSFDPAGTGDDEPEIP